MLFGLAPAWIGARTQPVDALRTGTRTAGSGATLLQRGLVVAQAALSIVLSTGAGLFSQSLDNLQNTNLRLDPRNCCERFAGTPRARRQARALPRRHVTSELDVAFQPLNQICKRRNQTKHASCLNIPEKIRRAAPE